ncbi:LysR family transcriptional regulator [Bacillus pumilus]|uniref:LysR family transcriptional regulator n=1 Tax=Bacillus pumilus TaxID=1408 RepID=UPI00017A6780|nr:LysR family transcriptional regulator [Bacillus pumilus]EDW21686.1 transcriptional regulator [Bacillus pumilus ATCC 7061]MCR4355456.1 LysR family transcriptional regulator [Bacillus pumilus]MCY7505470.1 LysR family transcriptional regulator [Bacillus pumilus]MED4631001.1 LysR family transcriptional regulator [Bacillus pumilus]MED4673068.1 LysR family transcriptional regulator [Bacillus pumilus]
MTKLITFQYKVFLTVVECGSFTKAGEKLGLTQSGVSHNIAKLESELGIVLLRRNRNGLALTDAGERVMPHIRQIIHHASLLEQEAALIQGMEVGSIKIGTFSSFSSKMLPQLIHRFTKGYPNIQVELYEGGYEEIEDWIASGTVDVGFLTQPSREFETVPLFQDELVVLMQEEHRFNTKKVIEVDSLHDESFIMPKAGCDLLIKKLLKERGVKPHVLFEIGDNNTLISMVQEGLGMTIIPTLILAPQMSHTKVIPLETSVYREINLAFKSFKAASPSAKRWIEVVKDHFK